METSEIARPSLRKAKKKKNKLFNNDTNDYDNNDSRNNRYGATRTIITAEAFPLAAAGPSSPELFSPARPVMFPDTDEQLETSSNNSNNEAGEDSAEPEHFITESEFNRFRLACKENLGDNSYKKMSENGKQTVNSFNYVCRASNISKKSVTSRFDEGKLRQCLINLLEAQEREKSITKLLPPAREAPHMVVQPGVAAAADSGVSHTDSTSHEDVTTNRRSSSAVSMLSALRNWSKSLTSRS
jgi:hypothetical protein